MGRRRGGCELHDHLRAHREEDGGEGDARGSGPPVVRHDDARGDQPQAPRRHLRPALRHRGIGRPQSARGGSEGGEDDPRRQRDDRQGVASSVLILSAVHPRIKSKVQSHLRLALREKDGSW